MAVVVVVGGRGCLRGRDGGVGRRLGRIVGWRRGVRDRVGEAWGQRAEVRVRGEVRQRRDKGG